MVSSCCVKGCSEKFVKGGGVSYFRISSKPEMQRNAWISALKRNGWTPKPHHRICSRHFVTGTWNADPNHIDYIPTRGMNNDANSTNDNHTEAYGMDSSMNDSIESFNQIHSNGACHTDQHPSSDSYNEASSNQPTIRVPVAGLSSSHFNSGKSPLSTSLKMRTSRRKQPKPWSSSPKLTSSHFCEHNDIHRICCRVIRELAEENTILKSQVECLMREVDKLRSQSVLSIMSSMSAAAAMQQPHSDNFASRDALLPQHPEPPQLKSAPQMNGGSHHTGGASSHFDNLQDIEVVSESPPSLGINDELGILTDDLEDDDLNEPELPGDNEELEAIM